MKFYNLYRMGSFTDRIKRFRLFHWIYNLLHYRSLLHNRAAFKKYKVNKSVFSSISSKDFPDDNSKAWLDVGDSRELAASKPEFHQFAKDIQKQILDWSDKGYIILRNFFDKRMVNEINEEIDKLVNKGKLHPSHDNKLSFANRRSPLIKNITHNEGLTKILSFILGKEVVPFQTLNFIKGSSQRAHSDSIHMTTYPLGFLVAAWIALEDTNAENGALFIYPSSHKLPFLLNRSYNNEGDLITLGRKDYTEYEDMIDEMIEKKGFKKEIFYAKEGDVIIWHANLIHGGQPIFDQSLTRKSMVIHYYAEDVIKYHEITERPSLLPE